MSRRLSYQEKREDIYDSDSAQDEEDDIMFPIGRKINSKGTYMNRIDNIKIDREGEGVQGDEKSNSEVLKKNRQSARECRERKKIYIELLEKKVDQLKRQIQTSKTNLRAQLKTLNKITSEMDPDKMTYLTEKMEIEKGMSTIDAKESPKQMKNLIDLYLYKFDVNGKLRKQLVSAQFQNLLKLILDHKLLNYWDGSLGVNDLFDANCFDIFSIETGNTIQYPLASNIHNNRSTMLHLLMQIRDVKRNLEAQGERIQYLVEKLAKHLSPEGILKFLLHPLYAAEANRLEMGMLVTDSVTSVSTKKTKRQ